MQDRSKQVSRALTKGWGTHSTSILSKLGLSQGQILPFEPPIKGLLIRILLKLVVWCCSYPLVGSVSLILPDLMCDLECSHKIQSHTVKVYYFFLIFFTLYLLTLSCCCWNVGISNYFGSCMKPKKFQPLVQISICVFNILREGKCILLHAATVAFDEFSSPETNKCLASA